MAENPEKSAFGAFVPEEGGLPGRDVIGAPGTQPSEEQTRALDALRAWDAMAQGAYPPNTVRAWRADWRAFIHFCFGRSESPLPASPHTVRTYVQHCMAEEKKPATIRRYLATIARAHRAAEVLGSSGTGTSLDLAGLSGPYVLNVPAVDYIDGQAAPEIRQLFLSQRKAISLMWVRRVRSEILSLMHFHRSHSRFHTNISLLTEMRLALDFAGLLFVCRILETIFSLRGPYAAPRLVQSVAAAASRLCTASEKSLAFLNVPGVNAFRGDSPPGNAAV